MRQQHARAVCTASLLFAGVMVVVVVVAQDTVVMAGVGAAMADTVVTAVAMGGTDEG